MRLFCLPTSLNFIFASFRAYYFILFIYFLILTQRCLLILQKEGTEREREKHRCERGTSTSCLLYTPQLGIELTTFLVHRTTLQPTGPPGQDTLFFSLYSSCLFLVLEGKLFDLPVHLPCSSTLI